MNKTYYSDSKITSEFSDNKHSLKDQNSQSFTEKAITDLHIVNELREICRSVSTYYIIMLTSFTRVKLFQKMMKRSADILIKTIHNYTVNAELSDLKVTLNIIYCSFLS